MKFINPAPLGNIDNFLSSSKVMVINSYPNQRVVSPFAGVVSNINPLDQTIEIEHNVNGTKYYSKIKGVVNFYVSLGYRVLQGDILGFFGDKPIEFSITDKLGFKQNLDFFFQDFKSKEQPDKETKEKSEKEKKEKSEKEKKEKSEKEKKEKSELSVDLGLSTDEDIPALYRGMMNLFAAPFSVVGSAFKGNLVKKTKKEEKEEKINENVKRIKNLIKF
jgi:hypothetical protein